MSISIIHCQTTNIIQVLRYKLFLFSLMSVIMVTITTKTTSASVASYNHPFHFIDTGSTDSDSEIQPAFKIESFKGNCECVMISIEPVS